MLHIYFTFSYDILCETDIIYIGEALIYIFGSVKDGVLNDSFLHKVFAIPIFAPFSVYTRRMSVKQVYFT